MKKLIFLFFLLAFCLVQAANDKKVYLIDVSGSMIGEGSVPTFNVFQSSINELKNAILVMEDGVEVVIIPFADNVHQPIVGYSSDKEYLLKQIDSIRVSGKRTDLIKAFSAAIKEIDSVVETEVYFITDGFHNGQKDTNVLFSKLNDYPNSTQACNCTLYYYLTDGQYRDMTVCKIFDKNNNMELVESLVKQKHNIIQETNGENSQTVAEEGQTKSKRFLSFLFNIGSLWIILLILLALALLYVIVRHVLPNIGGFPISVSTPINSANNIEAVGKKTLRELTAVSKEFKQLYESFSSRISKEFADDIAVTQEKQWTRMFSKKFPNSEIKTSGSTVVAKAGSTKSSGPVNEFLNHPLKNKTYMVDDAFVYETDDLGRTAVAWADRTKAYNTISRNTQRNSNIQKDVIRRLDGREGLDDAGHLFANNTGGPNELINQVPMSRELNRNGQWRKLEQMEEKALAAGKDVKSGRRVIYQGESKRPSAFEFISIIDGEETRLLIENI